MCNFPIKKLYTTIFCHIKDINSMKQLFYKEHLIENKSVRIAENLEKFLLGIGLEQNDIDHAKNPIIRNLLMKIADINNPRMHQYFVDDLLTTSDPEIKLYKFNS